MFFFKIDTTLASDHPLRFRKSFRNNIKTIKDY